MQSTVQALLIGIKETLEQDSVFRGEIRVQDLANTKPAMGTTQPLLSLDLQSNACG
jgi:hypothetical protein